MKLTPEEVRKIAKLGRLKLTDAEVATYQTQLSEVLGYIETLNEVDTEGVLPTAQVSGKVNALADDVVTNQSRTDDLLAGVPAREGNHLKVKAVFRKGAPK